MLQQYMYHRYEVHFVMQKDYCWKTEKQNEHVRMNCCNARGVRRNFTMYVAGHGCTSIKSTAAVKVQCYWSKEKVVMFD